MVALAIGASILSLGLAGPVAQAPAGPENLVIVEYLLPAERIVLYPRAGVLRRTSGLELSGIAQTAFDQDFMTETYYSAFALSKSGGYGYSTTSNSLDGARDIAMHECMSQNTNCIIVAEIVPAGYREMQQGDISMSPEVSDLFINPQAAGAPVGVITSMAISEDGAYALVWGHPDRQASDNAAMSDCRGNLLNYPGMREMPCVVLPPLE
ncbi:MAG: hypothetical protein JKX69_04060 [Rhodobacteraceae bacterium]|nr:hypothetical protein [Paracoccaceae bacterium]